MIRLIEKERFQEELGCPALDVGGPDSEKEGVLTDGGREAPWGCGIRCQRGGGVCHEQVRELKQTFAKGGGMREGHCVVPDKMMKDAPLEIEKGIFDRDW